YNHPQHTEVHTLLYVGSVNCVYATGLTHCLSLLTQGYTSMADGAVAVRQLLALCGALHNLAVQNAPLTRDASKVCLDACKQCSKACKEHAAHHAECKACYESYLDCIEECEKLVA
ncbi:four-helix bundle copper-binding protein, partial [Neisseria cinerea]|uniref:four-helix bundle copper-binding protein n=1 Tax=Neisseria cinerea TaxID=483 RepID=UPI002B1D510E